CRWSRAVAGRSAVRPQASAAARGIGEHGRVLPCLVHEIAESCKRSPIAKPVLPGTVRRELRLLPGTRVDKSNSERDLSGSSIASKRIPIDSADPLFGPNALRPCRQPRPLL